MPRAPKWSQLRRRGMEPFAVSMVCLAWWAGCRFTGHRRALVASESGQERGRYTTTRHGGSPGFLCGDCRAPRCGSHAPGGSGIRRGERRRARLRSSLPDNSSCLISCQHPRQQRRSLLPAVLPAWRRLQPSRASKPSTTPPETRRLLCSWAPTNHGRTYHDRRRHGSGRQSRRATGPASATCWPVRPPSGRPEADLRTDGCFGRQSKGRRPRPAWMLRVIESPHQRQNRAAGSLALASPLTGPPATAPRHPGLGVRLLPRLIRPTFRRRPEPRSLHARQSSEAR